jgi:hypothetical protein
MDESKGILRSAIENKKERSPERSVNIQPCGCKEDQSELCPVGDDLSTQSSAAFQKYMAYQRTNERVGVTRETMEKVYAAYQQKRTLFLKHILGGHYEPNG